MLARERSPSAIALPIPTPLPSLTSALSRRAALFGAVTSTGVLVGSASSALSLSAGIETDQASPAADATLIVQADAFRSLCTREYQAWDALCDDDQAGETPALTACRVLSQACRDAGEVLALVGPRLDTQANLSEHEGLVVSIMRDAVRVGGHADA